MTHDDLVILTRWMADNDWPAKEIAYAVAKPQKFEDELLIAKTELDLALTADRGDLAE